MGVPVEGVEDSVEAATAVAPALMAVLMPWTVSEIQPQRWGCLLLRS